MMREKSKFIHILIIYYLLIFLDGVYGLLVNASMIYSLTIIPLAIMKIAEFSMILLMLYSIYIYLQTNNKKKMKDHTIMPMLYIAITLFYILTSFFILNLQNVGVILPQIFLKIIYSYWITISFSIFEIVWPVYLILKKD